MLLYKYRSFENIRFLYDIIMNRRLYCAPLEDLNDPFEGTVRMRGRFAVRNWTMSIFFQKIKMPDISVTREFPIQMPTKYRICSLSSSLNEILMWAHYANGYNGVVIEIEIDDKCENLYRVNYIDSLDDFNESISNVDFGLLYEERVEISRLTTKFKNWSYENEFRILSEENYFIVDDNIKAIYFGINCDETKKISLIKKLPRDISAFDTELNYKSLTIEPSRCLNKG